MNHNSQMCLICKIEGENAMNQKQAEQKRIQRIANLTVQETFRLFFQGRFREGIQCYRNGKAVVYNEVEMLKENKKNALHATE
jgi:hypothetical protein